MKRIAYLLHRFPAITDTFIKREIRSLHKAGTDVEIISTWKPRDNETTPGEFAEWRGQTQFLLPRSSFLICGILLATALQSPARFFGTLRLALATLQPGMRGFVYQIFYFAEAVLAAKALKKAAVRHVHNHFGDHSGIVTMLAAKLANISYSISFHGPHVFMDGKSSRIREKVRGAGFIRAISYFCQSQVILMSGCTDLNLYKVVHCGLEPDKYLFRLPRKEVKRIFCAARLAPEKGFTFLFEALALLLKSHYELELRLAGDGPSRAALEALAKELGLTSKVCFLGYQTEAQVTRELYAADLFVLPSLAEGLPISAMEAMAVGVPVVATNIAGTSELVEHEKTGLLVRPSDPQALADAVIRMIEDNGFKIKAAELGRKKVIDEFDIDKETAKLNENFARYLD